MKLCRIHTEPFCSWQGNNIIALNKVIQTRGTTQCPRRERTGYALRAEISQKKKKLRNHLYFQHGETFLTVSFDVTIFIPPWAASLSIIFTLPLIIHPIIQPIIPIMITIGIGGQGWLQGKVIIIYQNIELQTKDAIVVIKMSQKTIPSPERGE